MNKTKDMRVLLIAAVSFLALAVGLQVFMKKRKVKESSTTDSGDGLENDNRSLENLFDSMIEPGTDDNTPSEDSKAKETKLVLENRSWWDVSGSTVIFYSSIIVVSALIFFLSMLSNSAYNDRKEKEQSVIDSLRTEKEKINQLSLERDEARMHIIDAKLDSINLHIQSLKPAKKVAPKTKQQKK